MRSIRNTRVVVLLVAVTLAVSGGASWTSVPSVAAAETVPPLFAEPATLVEQALSSWGLAHRASSGPGMRTQSASDSGDPSGDVIDGDGEPIVEPRADITQLA